MRLHRFFVAEKIGKRSDIVIDSKELALQISRVLRLRRDDPVVIFDGFGYDYECRIADIGRQSVTLNILNVSASRYMPERNVTLYASLIKKDKFEWIAEKATELGVSKIVPIISERSEKKAVNIERIKKIIVESSEQSGRGSVPIVGELVGFRDAVANVNIDKTEKKIAFHTEQTEKSANNYNDKAGSLSVFVGPEGGWSQEEIDMFHRHNMDVVCLGPQVLRAETAAVAALSVLMLK